MSLSIPPPDRRLPADDIAVPGVVIVDRQQRLRRGGQRRHPTATTMPAPTPVISALGVSHAEGDQRAVQRERREAQRHRVSTSV